MPPPPRVGGERDQEDCDLFAEPFRVVEARWTSEGQEGERVALGLHLRVDGYLHLGDAARHGDAVSLS